MSALDEFLADRETSAGMRAQIDHVEPARAGTGLGAEAVLAGVARRRLVFTTAAHNTEVGKGSTVRITAGTDPVPRTAGRLDG